MQIKHKLFSDKNNNHHSMLNYGYIDWIPLRHGQKKRGLQNLQPPQQMNKNNIYFISISLPRIEIDLIEFRAKSR